MADRDDPLAVWKDDLYSAMLVLEDIELRDSGVVCDHSAASLRGLERLLLDRAEIPGELPGPGRWGLTKCAAAYLGETLMRLAGGRWDWADGLPVARPDAATGLEPVSPVRLIEDAVRVRDGERFAAVYTAWEREAARAKRARPSWRPVKERTGADEPDPGSAHLAGWLARRAADFPGWAAADGPDGAWDFSPGSLTRLSDRVRRETPTEAELNDPANRDARDGAAWYLGEVLRRGIGARWNYNDGRHADDNLPYLDRLGPGKLVSWPFTALEIALTDPGYLRRHYDDVAE